MLKCWKWYQSEESVMVLLYLNNWASLWLLWNKIYEKNFANPLVKSSFSKKTLKEISLLSWLFVCKVSKVPHKCHQHSKHCATTTATHRATKRKVTKSKFAVKKAKKKIPLKVKKEKKKSRKKYFLSIRKKNSNPQCLSSPPTRVIWEIENIPNWLQNSCRCRDESERVREIYGSGMWTKTLKDQKITAKCCDKVGETRWLANWLIR